jgi:hypothetical protein
MWLLSKSNAKFSSRSQIQIKEVKDDILILPNNKYLVILETSAINIELKSTAEQDVLIDSFQNLLNALPCKLQILIRVREIDVDQYVEQIMQNREKETDRVYKTQIKNYAEFIKNLVSGNKILSRRFYIVIPYTPEEKGEDFDLIKGRLKLFTDVVNRGLEILGMKVKQLNSLEILELFYTFYNPDHFKLQPLIAKNVQEALYNA